MTTTPTFRDLPERLRRRAEAMPPDKRPPLIHAIIEVRQVLAEQRLRGQSWAALAGMLGKEGLHLSPGTLRNYVAVIGKAEALLHDAGILRPSDAEIHAALRMPSSVARQPERPPAILVVAQSSPASSAPRSVPLAQKPASGPASRLPTAAAPSTPSLTRNPHRQL